MTTDPTDPTDPLEAARRANRALSERIAELERQLMRFGEGGEALPLGAGLSEREALLAEAERIAHMGSWVWNVVSDEVRWSDELFRILGCDPTTDVASTDGFFARVHPDDRERVRAASARGIRSGVSEQVDFRVLRPDGNVRHVTMDGALLFGADGQLQRAVGAVLDVTDAHESALALRRTAELLADAQRMGNMGSFESNRDRGELIWSEQLYRILGVDPATPASDEALLSSLHPADREAVADVLAHAGTEPAVVSRRVRVVHPDGALRHVDLTVAALRDEAGAVRAIRGAANDVTELVALEAQFHQSQKMEAIGQLAGGLAHDFNNLLTVILGNCQFLLRTHPELTALRDVVSAATTARDLTSRLLTLARQSMSSTRVLRLGHELELARGLYEHAVGNDIALRLNLHDTWPLRVDAAQLQQVVLNLALNARDAMPHGGTLTLTSADRAVSVQATRHGVPPGDFVVLEVTDTGLGMDERTQARVFEPFFTTKGPGRGTGLGLAMVFGAMRQAGGFVEVRSTRGVGTTFTLWFPRTTDEPEEAGASPLDPPIASARVLLVEDDDAVARVTRMILESGGYRVEVATSALAGLEAWARTPADVLITDVRMAGMSGVKLDECLRAKDPQLLTLFVTGHSTEHIDLSTRAGRAAVLMKPYSREQLLVVLAELLAPATSG